MPVEKNITIDDLPTGEPTNKIQGLEVELPTSSNENEDGSIDITFGEVDAFDPEASEHGDNLALYLDDDELNKISQELLEFYDEDCRSREDWETTYKKGLKLLGLKIEERTQPWPGACGVFHPVLTEAVIRFQSQAIMEIFPPQGPVKANVMGRETEEKVRQARRVQDELNYQLTEKMQEFRAETETMLFYLPLAGSAFKKVYKDDALGRPVSMFVPAEDMLVPYGTSDLRTASRVTHVMRVYPNDLLKQQVGGFYRDIDIPEPSGAVVTPINEELDNLKGSKSVARDNRHIILEMHIYYDLPRFEDANGIALPYVISVEKDSGKVLAIRRNWKEDDPARTRRQHFVPYQFMPGLGFYGSGLIHLIGGIAASSTSILRMLVDAGWLATVPGGMKTRGLRIKGDDSPIMPGEFKDVDVPSGKILDNIAFLPTKEPSGVLFELLNKMVEEGRRLGAVPDMPIGQVNTEAPVGTTLAIMERSMKVMSAVQARLHASLRQELKLIAEIIAEMGDEYDYEVEEQGVSRSADFDARIDIIPVSDPNAASMAVRIAQHQAALQLAQMKPEIYDEPELHREMLVTIGYKNVERIVPGKDVAPMDPVTENMALITGKPVKAFMYQDHEAHIQVHLAAAQDPKIAMLVGQSPNAPMIQGALAAHVSEHLAFQYRREIEKQMGVALPPPEEKLPEDVEVQVSRLTAEAAARLLKKDQAEAKAQQIAAMEDDPVLKLQKAELEVKRLKVIADSTKADKDRELKRDELEAKVGMDMLKVRSGEKVAGAALGVEIAQDQATRAAEGALRAAEIKVDAAKADAQTEVQREQIAAQERASIRQAETARATAEANAKAKAQQAKSKESGNGNS